MSETCFRKCINYRFRLRQIEDLKVVLHENGWGVAIVVEGQLVFSEVWWKGMDNQILGLGESHQIQLIYEAKNGGLDVMPLVV